MGCRSSKPGIIPIISPTVLIADVVIPQSIIPQPYIHPIIKVSSNYTPQTDIKVSSKYRRNSDSTSSSDSESDITSDSESDSDDCGDDDCGDDDCGDDDKDIEVELKSEHPLCKNQSPTYKTCENPLHCPYLPYECRKNVKRNILNDFKKARAGYRYDRPYSRTPVPSCPYPRTPVSSCCPYPGPSRQIDQLSPSDQSDIHKVPDDIDPPPYS